MPLPKRHRMLSTGWGVSRFAGLQDDAPTAQAFPRITFVIPPSPRAPARHTAIGTTAAHIRPVSRELHPPRHPVVLCHGLFGFDKIGPDAIPHLQLHYWRGIREALVDLGARVYVGRVSPAESVQCRAEQLHRQLSRVFRAGEQVNLVGHSMGGLDARYLISRILRTGAAESDGDKLESPGYSVRSLATVCTPHRGSPFMDWCRDHIGLGAKGVVAAAAAVAGMQISDEDAQAVVDSKNPPSSASAQRVAPYLATGLRHLAPILTHLRPALDLPAYHDLTTTYLTRHFNTMTPNDPNVLYHSYAARVKDMPLMHPLRIPWEIVNEREGESDGLVSVMSAKWGKLMGICEADHWDMNKGWRVPAILGGGGGSNDGFDASEFYVGVVSELYKEGC